MEPNRNPEDDPRIDIIDDSIILVGLLLMQSSLFKSGYEADVIVGIHDRLAKLIKYYGKKGL